MRTKFNGILTLFLALIVQISFAQERTISGTVSDESGPLPGVTILKKGTTKGTETDFDGNYSIQAKTGDVLVFSFVGMKTMEKTVGASDSINVTMSSDNLLEEVVVVAYGSQKKEEITGAVTTIKTESLENVAAASVTQGLVGQVAGVQIINQSGAPGADPTVRFRGIGSINSWFDLKRFKLPLDRTGHPSFGNISITPEGDFFRFQIPEGEINSNPKINSSDQNP
ncbi:carboxypeptidase-like regulatory domain-containing protein [Tenacibaculum mesophilum]|uniref:carboxypeptidase-like regulatory domain-containing protein n=1 Tax=Tenacibaculum mesophilum TaxID=104268 RepID=UPI0037493974